MNWIVLSDHALERLALCHILEGVGSSKPQCFSTDRVKHAREASVKCPLCTLVFVFEPGASGRVTLETLLSEMPNIPIVIVLRNPQDFDDIAAPLSNVHAVVDRDCPEALLQSIFRVVGAGHRILGPRSKMRESALDETEYRYLKKTGATYPASLTLREREICREVSTGKSNKEIGLLLGVTENTVSAHLAAIRRKLGLRNRTQIALLSTSVDARHDPQWQAAV